MSGLAALVWQSYLLAGGAAHRLLAILLHDYLHAIIPLAAGIALTLAVPWAWHRRKR